MIDSENNQKRESQVRLSENEDLNQIGQSNGGGLE